MSATSRKKVGDPTELYTINLTELLIDGNENAFREFLANLFAAERVMAALRQYTSGAAGLTPRQYAVLFAVSQRSSPPTVREIADHLQVAAPNVTADLGTLEKLGLIAKGRHPTDQRALQIKLTRSGTALVLSNLPLMRSVNGALFDTLSANDMKMVTRVMNAIARGGTKYLNDRKLDGPAEP